MENLLEWFQSLLVGLVQGFTEPLPVSSSGHVVLLRTLLNEDVSDLSYEIFLNSASFLAVVFVLRKDLYMLIKESYKALKERKSNDAFKMSQKILLGSFPILIIGLFFRDVVESWLSFNSLLLVGLGLLFTSLVLAVSHKVSKTISKDLGFKESLIIGFSQLVAIIPGISRSGMTFSAGVLNHISKKEALTYSMYLYLVVSFGSIVLSISDFAGLFNLNSVTAFIASLGMTILSLKWFYRILEKNSLKAFSLYCFAAGSITLIISWMM